MDVSALRQHALEAAALLKQLSNPNRLMIVCSLVDTEMSVGDLNTAVPLSQSALSQHLASLRDAELVTTRRNGQTIYYRLQGDKAIRVVSLLKDIYCPEKKLP